MLEGNPSQISENYHVGGLGFKAKLYHTDQYSHILSPASRILFNLKEKCYIYSESCYLLTHMYMGMLHKAISGLRRKTTDFFSWKLWIYTHMHVYDVHLNQVGNERRLIIHNSLFNISFFFVCLHSCLSHLTFRWSRMSMCRCWFYDIFNHSFSQINGKIVFELLTNVG